MKGFLIQAGLMAMSLVRPAVAEVSVALCFGVVTEDAVYSWYGFLSQLDGILDNFYELFMQVPDYDGTLYDTLRLVDPVGEIGNKNYDLFDQVLYIDASPGAYEPLGFKRESELKGGETAGYWSLPYGMLLWSPTDDTGGTQSGGEFISAYQFEPVDGVEGLNKIYWNQTLYEVRKAGGGRDMIWDQFPFCYSDTGILFTERGSAW